MTSGLNKFVDTAALLASLNSDLQLTASLQQLEVLLTIDGRLESEANWSSFCSDVGALPACCEKTEVS